MKTLTRLEAVEALARHGLTPKQNTYCGNETTGFCDVDGTSFDDEVGNRPEYTLREVMSWLGY